MDLATHNQNHRDNMGVAEQASCLYIVYTSLPDSQTFLLTYSLSSITATLLKRLARRPLHPITLPEKPEYVPERDVTLIVPTIDFSSDLLVALRSWLANKPKKIVLVTSSVYVEDLEALLAKADLSEEEDEKIELLATDKPNKRKQMVLGIPRNDPTATPIVVFADDDAYWSPTMLKHILAGFHNSPNIGVVGTFYRARGLYDPSITSRYTAFQALAARRLAGRRSEIAASYSLDDGITCISGRTAAYGTCIVADPKFIDGFTNEKWLGTWPLNSGDDQFTSQWVIAHGWEMALQSAEEAELETTVLEGCGFVRQWLRWQRGGQRSYLKRLCGSRQTYR